MSAPLARAAKGRSVAGPVAPWCGALNLKLALPRGREASEGGAGGRGDLGRAVGVGAGVAAGVGVGVAGVAGVWRRRKLPRRASFPRPENPPLQENATSQLQLAMLAVADAAT